jgi:hypothetical protein
MKSQKIINWRNYEEPSKKVEPKIIGYWGKNGNDQRYPWPQDYVDESQTETMINTIADYLDGGKFFEGYLGWSNCRICGCENGATELSDGVYVWPKGLSHYVREHKVRLPNEFVQHVIDKLEDMEE